MIRKWKAKPTQDNLNPHFNCSYDNPLQQSWSGQVTHSHALSRPTWTFLSGDCRFGSVKAFIKTLFSVCFIKFIRILYNCCHSHPYQPIQCDIDPHLPGNEAWTWKWTFCRFCLSPFLDDDLLNYKNGNKCQEHNFRRGKVDKSSVSEWKSKRLWNDPDIKVQTSLSCYREMLLDWLEIIHQAGYKLAKFYVCQTRCNQSATQLILQ